jgi:hypothetical protein
VLLREAVDRHEWRRAGNNIRALSPANLFYVITARDKPAATKWKKISYNDRSLLGILCAMNAPILKPPH